MPIYTPRGPFVDGGAPGIDHNFLNGVENQLVAVPYGINMLSTPFLLLSSVTLTPGTNTYTCTGGSTGVPAGAKAILLAGQFSSPTLYSYLQFRTHGSTNQGVTWGNITVTGTNGVINGNGIVLLDVNGQIDVTANTGNCIVIASITGYVY